MNVKVDDLMVPNVLTASPDDSIGVVRKRILRKKIHCLPVVDSENRPLGVISTSDLLASIAEETPVSEIMTRKVYSVARYDGAHVAARIMRNHHIHHLVVTHEHQIAGILSSFDLLKLVEDHRFVMKNPPAGSKKRTGKI